jgi:hypothetical protein
MEIFVLIIVGIAGIIIGRYFALRQNSGQALRKPNQSKKKAENKEKIL